MTPEADTSAGPPLIDPGAARLQLALATGAFAVCYAIFGSVSAMMPMLRVRLQLDSFQVSIAIAIPVLLGSLGRIPLGMLSDRYGGRAIFLWTLSFSIVPALLLGLARTYAELLACGFFAGIALASFAIGIGFVSGWFPPERQGTALGLYGAGNVGQALASFGSPVLAVALGYAWGFWAFAVLAALWMAIFFWKAQSPPRSGPEKKFADFLKPLGQRMAWVLSLFYFLTFGGVVSMSIYLPTLLTEVFGLTERDAGFRAAGFALVATLARPTGGWLADRYGSRAVLVCAFAAIAALPFLLLKPWMPTYTAGCLGLAAAMGLGNGAVFKLVPQHFPKTVGSVSGLVSASGGLGGFFPPLVLGVVKKLTGHYTLGFVLLAVFALACLTVCLRSLKRAASSGSSVPP